MKYICKQTGEEFAVTQKYLDLLSVISPVLDGKKYSIPVPQYHPDVSHQHHLAWRNERSLYRGKCDLTGKSCITNINPNSGYLTYYFKKWESEGSRDRE